MTPNKTSLQIIVSLSLLALLASCDPPAPAKAGGPVLEIDSLLKLGESPNGISVRETFTFSNTGDSQLRISDFSLKPDQGVFQLGINELPLEIPRGASVDVEVTFRPNDEADFESELILDFNVGDVEPAPIFIQGAGISNLV